MNLPNKITLFRVVMVPVFAVLALLPIHYGDAIAAIVFAVAAFSDFLDGHLARKYNLVSDFGKFMDPLADKMLVMTALLVLVSQQTLPAWVVIIIVCRDLAVDGLRFVAAQRQVVIAASRCAKLKTMTQMIMAILLLLRELFPYSWYTALCYVLIGAAVVLTVYSGAEYLINGRRFIYDAGKRADK